MQKVFWIATILILAISIGVFLLPAWAPREAPALPEDPMKVAYVIDSKGPAFNDEISIFGGATTGDLNGDGKTDAAVILVQQPGGSGTFYYVAAAINTGKGYAPTNAILLGDRIAPQTLEITKGVVIANFADRKPEEPFTTKPSIGKSLYAKIVGGKLVEGK